MGLLNVVRFGGYREFLPFFIGDLTVATSGNPFEKKTKTKNTIKIVEWLVVLLLSLTSWTTQSEQKPFSYGDAQSCRAGFVKK